MSREKHGRYDEQRGLPDNTGQPVGDGSRVWLMETVAQHWPDLVEAARRRSGNYYSWLVNELRHMNDEQATAIADEYRCKLSAAQHDQVQRDRRRQLAQYEEQAKTVSGSRLEYIKKGMAKLRRQIDKAEQRRADN